MKLDAYTRVSRVGGRRGDSFISPAEQRDRMAAWAKAHGHDIATFHEDLDQPGSKVDRPGLTSAIARIEAGTVEGLVVARLDRFGRSVHDSANLLARIRAGGGVLCTVAEGIDTSGYMGKFLADLFSALAELELARIRESWSAARTRAVARGVHVAGRTPLGYRRREDRVLEPDPDTAAVVPKLFELRSEGRSWAEMARYLEDEGVITTWGNEHWTVATVRSVIANRVYLGEARAGESIVNPDAHEALVGPRLYAAANRARGIMPARSGRSSGLLSGLLRCAGCRYAMKPSMGRTRKGARFLEYRCKPGKAAGRCESPASVTSTVIEPLVIERFFEFARDYTAREVDEDDELVIASEQLGDAQAELDAVLDTRLADALGGSESDAFLATVQERQRRVEGAQEAVARAEAEAVSPFTDGIRVTDVWDELERAEQRQLLMSVFDCIFLRRTPSTGKFPIADRTWFCWRGEGPTLPVRGQRGEIRPFAFPLDLDATSASAAQDRG